MANFKAIMGVSEAIMALLRNSYIPEDFDNDLEFRIFSSKDFTNNTITNGASLFLYRVYCNGNYRSPVGRMSHNGRYFEEKLPVELHFLLTVWAKDASLQHTLAGWVMRTLEDTPTLTYSVLNSAVPGVFSSDESVDVCLAELRTEDLFRIWDVLGLNAYQLSIPYMARVIHIDSTQPKLTDVGPVIQERKLRMGKYSEESEIVEALDNG